ncbi:hypothetical protein [Mycobacterium sp. URHB0021]
MSRRGPAHARSKKVTAKQARRKKRRAARDARWIPGTVFEGLSDEIEFAAVLERIDERITERGWVFDEELSDDDSALWFFPPSRAEVTDEEVVPATTIVLAADDGSEVAHVVFVGTADDYQFGLDELFDHLDVIESHRHGQPRPDFS